MRNATRFLALSTLSIGAMSLAIAGCSNGWLDSKARKETPAALMFDAQVAYDAEQFTKARELYGKAVDKDPANVLARVGEAFSYNGEAGLSIMGLLGRAIEQGMAGGSSQPATNLAAEPTATPTAGAGSEIAKIAKIVGLSDEELEALKGNTEAMKDADLLRAASQKFEKLHESWKAICPVLPKTAIDILKAEGDSVTDMLDVASCKDGISTNNGAAIFAAVVGVLAQSAALYQLLDTDYNGIPDVIDKVTTSFNSINTRNTAVSQASDLTKISEEVKGLADDTAELVAQIKLIDESDIIPMALANMQVLKSLLNSIQSIPTDVKATINSTLDKLEEAKTKFDDYKSKIGGLNSSSSSEGKATEMKKKAEEAAGKADAILGKQVEKLTIGSTATQKAEFKENQTQICSNFDALLGEAGLPAGTQKPCGCLAESEKNSCCAAKATEEEQASCCSGAYGPDEAAKATDCSNVSRSFLPLTAEPAKSLPPQRKPVDVANGLAALFRGAMAAWRN